MANKALLVGINKYKDHPLLGCVNDVAKISGVLDQKGFEIVSLLDENATKANIIEEFERLLADSTKEDVLVFHYSGHGSQVPDISGDEPDGLDECLLPIDYTWDNVIIDDTLDALIVKHAMKNHVEIILDACHSGSGTRSVLLECNLIKATQRFILPPKELFTGINNIFEAKVNNVHPRDVITWSGCRDDQTSSDAMIDGSPTGAFTHAFVSCLNNKTITRRKTLQCVRGILQAKGFSQQPQLSCNRNETGCNPFTIDKSWLAHFMFWK